MAAALGRSAFPVPSTFGEQWSARNSEVAARLRAARLAKGSPLVRKESVKVNAEFAAIERDPDG